MHGGVCVACMLLSKFRFKFILGEKGVMQRSCFLWAGGRRWRRGRAKRGLFAMLSSATDATFQRRNWKVDRRIIKDIKIIPLLLNFFWTCELLFMQMVVWVLVSLLPLVVGERPGFREDPVDAVGLVTTMLDEQPFDALPEEDEEMGDGDSHSPWHNVFGKFGFGCWKPKSCLIFFANIILKLYLVLVIRSGQWWYSFLSFRTFGSSRGRPSGSVGAFPTFLRCLWCSIQRLTQEKEEEEERKGEGWGWWAGPEQPWLPPGEA